MTTPENSAPRTFGRYQVLAERGRVLLGRAPDGSLVALHLAREADDEESRARFRREVEAARTMPGTRTASVVDADVDAPVPWSASVYVPGPSLQEVVDTIGPLPEESALRLAGEIAAGLAEVHRAGLLHGHLTASNVLLTEGGAKVVGFAGARTAGPPRSTSPERAEGDEPTAAGDVFSLGSVLALACTGAEPFAASPGPRTTDPTVHTGPDLAAIPPSLRPTVERCLTADPAARPSPARLAEEFADRTAVAWPEPVRALITERQAEADRLPAAGWQPGGKRGRRFTLVGALVGAVVLAAGVIWAFQPGEATPDHDGDPATEASAPEVELSGSTADASGVAFSPDGRTLAVTSEDGMVRLWDTSTHQQVGEPFTGLDVGLAVPVAFSPDGRTLATGGTVPRLWDVATRQPFGVIQDPEDIVPMPVLALTFSPDGRLLATAGFGPTRLWDMGNHQPVGPALTKSMLSVAFSPDGRTLAAGGQDGGRLWDVGSGQQVGQFAQGDWLFGVAFSPDGRIVAGTGGVEVDNAVRLWNTADQQQIGRPMGSGTSAVEFSPDGRTLVTVGGQAGEGGPETVQLWDVANQQQLGDPLGSGVLDVTYSPDGRRVAAPSGGPSTRLWTLPPNR